jgi:uncharacterized membrane protein
MLPGKGGDHRLAEQGIAAIVATCSAGIAVALAVLLALYTEWPGAIARTALTLLIYLPFLLPPIVTGLALLVASANAGLDRGLFTIVIGHTIFVLLAVIYYLGANDLLIDPRVMALTPAMAIGISVGSLVVGWIIYDLLCRSPIGDRTALLAFLVFLLACVAAYGFTHVFSGRAAFVHIGAFLGTIMAANVFLVIIPNQKKAVAALIAGKSPDPKLGKRGKQRSLHNNYLTLPVVLMMISNHYPMMFEHAQSWLIAVGILLFSGLVRLYANLRNAGASGSPVTAILFYAAMVGMGAIAYASYRPGADLDAVGPVTFAEVQAIMAHRCLSCHSATPTDAAYRVPPKGIAFDTPDQIQRLAPQIERMVVLTNAMPIGNKTGMLPEERLMIAKWLAESRTSVE